MALAPRPRRLTVEAFENVRGQMVLRSTWNEDQGIVTEPFARLEALPEAPFCLPCQESFEA